MSDMVARLEEYRKTYFASATALVLAGKLGSYLDRNGTDKEGALEFLDSLQWGDISGDVEESVRKKYPVVPVSSKVHGIQLDDIESWRRNLREIMTQNHR
jgi:hypothetical protein